MKTSCHEPAHPKSGSVRGAEPLSVTATCLASALEESLRHFVRAVNQNLGHLEAQVAQQAQELLRQATEAGAQQKADATPPVCPLCQQKLTRPSAGHPRTFATRFGCVTV